MPAYGPGEENGCPRTAGTTGSDGPPVREEKPEDGTLPENEEPPERAEENGWRAGAAGLPEKRRPSAISINLEKERRESDEDRHCHGGFLRNGERDGVPSGRPVRRLPGDLGHWQKKGAAGHTGREGSGEASEVSLNLTKKEDLEILAAALAEKKPEVKFLVNAAGFGITGPVGSFPEEEAASMVRLNCEGLTAVTELVLPYIPDNSRILQFASAAAFMPQPGFAVYAATKAYVLSYSRALGEELRRRRIFVTAVCPGPVDTEFFGKALNGKPMDPFKRLFMARTNLCGGPGVFRLLEGKTGVRAGTFHEGVLCAVPHLPPQPFNEISHMEIRGDGYVG